MCMLYANKYYNVGTPRTNHYIYKILLKTKSLITVLYITTRNNYSYVMASLKGRVLTGREKKLQWKLFLFHSKIRLFNKRI